MVKIFDIGRINVKSGEREVVAQFGSLPISIFTFLFSAHNVNYVITSMLNEATFQETLRQVSLET